MTNNNRSAEVKGTLVPVASSGQHPRRPANRNQPAAQPQQGITPQFALHVLQRWWRIAMPVGLLMAGLAAGVVWWMFEPQYRADTALMVKSQQPYLAFAPEGAERGARDIFVQTQDWLIRERLVLEPVVSRPDVAKVPELREEEDPVKWLAENLDIDPATKTNAITIALACARPEHSALIVNAVAEEYLARANHRDSDGDLRVIQALLEERDGPDGQGGCKSEVERLRNELHADVKELTDKDPLSDIRTLDSKLEHPLADLSSRLISVEVEEKVLRANIKALEKQNPEALAEESGGAGTEGADETGTETKAMLPDETKLTSGGSEQNTEMANLREQIRSNQESLENRESQLTEDAAEDDPECKKLRESIKEDTKVLIAMTRRAMSREQLLLLDEAVEQDSEVRRLRERIDFAEAMRGERESKLPRGMAADDHKCIEIGKSIEEDKRLLADRCLLVEDRVIAKLTLSGTTPVPARYQSSVPLLKNELAVLNRSLAGCLATKDWLNERLEAEKAKAERVSAGSLDLQFKREELAKAEEVYARLSRRILELSTEQRAPDQVELLRPAKPAVAPVSKLPYTGLGLASLLFFVPFGLAAAWEFLLRRVSDTQQLEQTTNVTVIGEVARLPVRRRFARAGSASVVRGMNVFEESIDGLRTHLMLSEELMDMSVLAVTSAASHEGKTSVAAQLAVNMALVSGKRTLLIDGDMRSPDVHSVFDIPQDPGLAEILSGECSVEDAIFRNDENRTDVIPAGRLRTSPHRLLGNGALGSFMKEVRSSYDYIIIDTPPILAASESLVLAREADRSLMCAMKDSSRIDQVKKAHERLVMAGGRPIGVVLNGVPTSHYMRQYGAYAYSDA